MSKSGQNYDLQLFDQPKIDQFVENWYNSRFQDPEESKRWQASLKRALTGRDRIQVLAKNPLLLTIIALIHRYEAYLPRDRHQLYNRAVETLLTNWDAAQDTKQPLPLFLLRLFTGKPIGPARWVIQRRPQHRSTGRKRSPRPPQMQRAGVPMANRLFTRRLHIDGFQW
jgi:predicted NACHT family NTPase